MSDKARSKPPELPDFTFEKWLGGGGFADVFLYRQHRPARQVAVKVLRADGLPPEARAAFDAEADLMAQVSAHPYIVSIYDTDVAPDGRPYLVMQYYPNPHYGVRSRGSGLDVAEVLPVGVRIASAIETAHRVGILHRDVKPANILVSEYKRPGLTDFGIAGTRDGAASEAQGVTFAYAPPEILASDAPGDERADVYSLAATLYALLAGRAPFEVPNGDNSTRAIAVRTLNEPVPPIGKPNVPQSLELLLQHAMAKRPGDRPASAAAFARGLQSIEQELQHPPTEFELAEVAAPPTAPAVVPVADDDEATRSGRVQVVNPERRPESPSIVSGAPQIAAEPVAAAAVVPAPPAFDAASMVPAAPAVDDTVQRPPLARPTADADASARAVEATETRPSSRPIGVLIGAAAAIVVVIAAIVAITASSSGNGNGTVSPTTTAAGVDALVLIVAPPAPSGVQVAVSGDTATVTWTADEAEEGDSYLVARTDGPARSEPATPADGSPIQIGGIEPGARPCFHVTAAREGRLSEPSPQGCAP